MKRNLALVLLVSLVLFFSCSKEPADPTGPEKQRPETSLLKSGEEARPLASYEEVSDPDAPGKVAGDKAEIADGNSKVVRQDTSQRPILLSGAFGRPVLGL